MSASLIGRGEDTSGLANVVGPCLPPADLSGVLSLVHLDHFTIDDQVTVLGLQKGE